jgi:hypothetical protein
MVPLLFLVGIVVVVAVGVYFKMYPRFPQTHYENFANPAVAPNQPSCVERSGDALVLLGLFKPCPDQYNAPTTDAVDRVELQLILNKLTCLDADVTNNGVAGYNTLNLPYNTSHDAEPLTNFVGRCLNNGTRSRDLEIVMDRYEKRGNTLIKQLCANKKIDPKAPLEHFAEVLKTTMNALTTNCLAQHSSLDKPFGPRDPGFSVPFTVSNLAPY